MKYVYAEELLESLFCIFSVLDVITGFLSVLHGCETLSFAAEKNKDYHHLRCKDV
jgi:hypothetical protein